MTNELYRLELEADLETVVARLAGEVDGSNADELHVRLLRSARGKHLVLDLTAVEYFDSSGIAMLNTLARETQLELVITSDSIVARAIDIVGLGEKIPISEATRD